MGKVRYRKIRILYTDLDATDSSSEEDEMYDDYWPGFPTARTCGRRIEHEISIEYLPLVQTNGSNGNNNSGDSSSSGTCCSNDNAGRKRRTAAVKRMLKKEHRIPKRVHSTSPVLALAITQPLLSPTETTNVTAVAVALEGGTRKLPPLPPSSLSLSSPSSVLHCKSFILDEEGDDSWDWSNLPDWSNLDGNDDISLLPRYLFSDSFVDFPSPSQPSEPLSFSSSCCTLQHLNNNNWMNPNPANESNPAADDADNYGDLLFDLFAMDQEGKSPLSVIPFPSLGDLTSLGFDSFEIEPFSLTLTR